MEMRFLYTLTVVTLWVGQAEQTLLEEFTMVLVSNLPGGFSDRLTLSRSRRRMQYFQFHEYQRHQQFHLHPSGRYATGHGHGKSLDG